jgi:DNA-binding HxlR family transcriptional regulator
MKKKCLSENNCPLARAYEAIGDWWSLLILSAVLLSGARRFGEIQEHLGMARNILTSRLTKLVDDGILVKVPAADGTSYHEYAPTERGEDLLTVIVALRQWGERHFFGKSKCSNLLVSQKNKRPIPQLSVRDAKGNKLSLSDLTVIES